MAEPTIANVPLTEWMKAHPVKEEMYWKNPAYQQMNFVRTMIARGILQEELSARVISTHHSKSIELPVYRVEFTAKDGTFIKCTFRNNFYNWNLSVEASEIINLNFDDLIHPDQGYCYVEGMEEFKWGMYTRKENMFTVALSVDYQLFTVIWLLKHKGQVNANS